MPGERLEKTITEDDHLFTIERCKVCGRIIWVRLTNEMPPRKKEWICEDCQ
jgi:hypothetical protein